VNAYCLISETILPGVEKMITSYTGTHETIISLNEADLVLAAQKGNLEAFNHLVLSYQDRIFNLSARILGDHDLAEDITQNTFLTAYLNLPRFRNGSFRSWLFRIATNLCYDVHRRYKRYPVMSLENEVLAEERISPLYDFSGSSILPEMEVERHELEQVIQQALNRLDADQRTIVVLIDQQDFDYAEVAQILRIPIGTVKSRLARARLRLRQLLSTLSSIMQPI
jgi:RNA polymerase sigma-70 factor (ECF subfamily)